MKPVLSIAMIVLYDIAVASFFLISPIQSNIRKPKTVQKFVNVKDIHDNFLYTRDCQIIA